MARERSVHFRLTVWYALILAAALGLFSGLLWLSLRQRLVSEVDRGLSDRAAQFQSLRDAGVGGSRAGESERRDGGVLPGSAAFGLSRTAWQ